jgi:hypothetical protein
MVVVPGLAHCGERQPGEVLGLVLGIERLAPEHVAERVDAVGDVMDEEDSHRPTPEKPGEAGPHGAPDRDPEPERHRQAEQRPYREGAIDEANHRVAEKVGSEAALAAPVGVDEQPANMGMDEPPQSAAPTGTVPHVGAVRVALLVGEGMVAAVIGDPGDHRSLDRG